MKLSAALSALLPLSCGVPASDRATASPPSIELFSAESFDYRGAELRAHGLAAHVLYRRDTGDALGSQVKAIFPARPRSPGRRATGATVIEAPLASGNPLGQSVDGEGSVRLSTESGDRAETFRASYRGEQALAFGDRPVRLVGPGYSVDAPGFRLDTIHDLLQLGKADLVSSGAATAPEHGATP
ncbi:MAG: LptA/OstA family protein [Deltaproteobacteria bacterium]